MEWISVKDRLPNDGDYKIVYCVDGNRRHVSFAKFQNRYKQFNLTGARSYWRVTHWMPLPAPPKEETNETD